MKLTFRNSTVGSNLSGFSPASELESMGGVYKQVYAFYTSILDDCIQNAGVCL